jgi:O-antigen ligase
MSDEIAKGRPRGLGFGLYVGHLLTLFGIALSNILLGLAIVAAPWAGRWSRRSWERFRRLVPPLTLYIVGLALSIALSLHFDKSVGAFGEIFALMTLFLAPIYLVGERRVRLAVDGFVWSAGVYAAYGLAQFLVGYGGIDLRIRGPFSHYMTFAGILLMADFLLIARLVLRPSDRRRWYWWLILALINLALLGSLTRSAWVALALTLTALLALKAPRLLLGYLPAVALFLILAPAPLVSRVLSIVDLRDVSNYDRICMAEAGLHMVRQRPLFGIGPNLVKELYPFYRHPTSPRLLVPHLHNAFLELAAERGLTSLLAYLWLMGGVVILGIRRYRQARREGRSTADLYLGVVLGLLAFNCAGLFEDNWSDAEVQRVALFLAGIPFCLPWNESAEEREENAP